MSPTTIFMPFNIKKPKFLQSIPHSCAVLYGYDGVVLTVFKQNGR